MSPSEDQLRAALRHGAGEPIDVDGLVQHAAAVRRGRRIRIASIAAAVIAVAGIGVGAAVAFSGGDHHKNVDAHSPVNSDGLRGLLSSGSEANAPSTRSTEQADAQSTACPAALPDVDTGAGTGPLYLAPVQTVVVCGYFVGGQPIVDGGVPVSALFDGAAARDLASSMESAPKSPPITACPAVLSANARVLALFATGPDGALPVVTFQLDRPTGCGAILTNGSSTRYNWIPSSVLSAYLTKIRQLDPTPNGGANSGSPAH